jgi:N-acetylneuraminic acid mutarotase
MTADSTGSSSSTSDSSGGTGAVRNSWSRVAALPESRGFPASALASQDRLFVIGGFDSASKNDSALVQALSLDTMTWSGCT